MVDFGCGCGIDTILAAHKVGPSGKVIGIDFSERVLDRARKNADETELENIEFLQANLRNLPSSMPEADVIISNCVICLCPEKGSVYREAFRVLTPGGRIAISDIVTTGKIETEARDYVESEWIGPLGGALEEDEYLRIVEESGFDEIEVVSWYHLNSKEIFAMANCPGPKYSPKVDKDALKAFEGKLCSIKFTARKPI